jgi:hypothetical protein
LFGGVVGMDLGLEAAVGRELVAVVGARWAQHVTPGLGDLERVRPQAGVVGDVDVGLLAGTPGLPAHEATHRLAEEQLGRRGGREHADAQAGDVDALGHHPHRHEPRPVVAAELGDALRRGRIVADDHVGRGGEPVAQQAGDALGVVLVDGDDETAGVGCPARIVRSCSLARASTLGIHSPSRLRAVRNRIDIWSLVSSSWKLALTTSPAAVVHSMSPSTRGK